MADEGVKFALIADQPDVYFTTPHFDGYPAVLVKLEEIEVIELEELITEALADAGPQKAGSGVPRRVVLSSSRWSEVDHSLQVVHAGLDDVREQHLRSLPGVCLQRRACRRAASVWALAVAGSESASDVA